MPTDRHSHEQESTSSVAEQPLRHFGSDLRYLAKQKKSFLNLPTRPELPTSRLRHSCPNFHRNTRHSRIPQHHPTPARPCIAGSVLCDCPGRRNIWLGFRPAHVLLIDLGERHPGDSFGPNKLRVREIPYSTFHNHALAWFLRHITPVSHLIWMLRSRDN